MQIALEQQFLCYGKQLKESLNFYLRMNDESKVPFVIPIIHCYVSHIIRKTRAKTEQ